MVDNRCSDKREAPPKPHCLWMISSRHASESAGIRGAVVCGVMSSNQCLTSIADINDSG